MSSYCANYYGSINCHNSVPSFGDRCALCLSKGVTSSPQIEHGNMQWAENVQREQMRREEEKIRRARVSRTSSGRIR